MIDLLNFTQERISELYSMVKDSATQRDLYDERSPREGNMGDEGSRISFVSNRSVFSRWPNSERTLIRFVLFLFHFVSDTIAPPY